jgi:hypothetical protein
MRLAWHFILPNADRLCVVVAQYFSLLRSHQEFVPCGVVTILSSATGLLLFTSSRKYRFYERNDQGSPPRVED